MVDGSMIMNVDRVFAKMVNYQSVAREKPSTAWLIFFLTDGGPYMHRMIARDILI